MAYTAFFDEAPLSCQSELVKTLLGFQLRVCSRRAMGQHLLDRAIMERKGFVGCRFLHCTSCKDDPFCMFSPFLSPPLFFFANISFHLYWKIYPVNERIARSPLMLSV